MKKVVAYAMLALVFSPSVAMAESSSARARSVVTVNNETVEIENEVEASNEAKSNREYLKHLKEQTREEFKSEKEAALRKFQENLQKIKDEKKRLLVARINTKLCDINSNRTKVMLRQLNKMEEILAKVEARAAASGSAGKDMSTVTAAVASAEAKIADAKAAVSAQAAMDCTLDISGSNATLSGEVKHGVSELEQLLRGVNQKVKEARRAVSQAIVALAHTMGNKLQEKPEGTD